jgi:hypothetical protein
MMRPTIGVKLTAVAVGLVTTAGVAAAATVGHAPAADVSIQPASVESDVLDNLPVDLPAVPDLTDLTTLPTTPATVPSLPALPSIPQLPSVPGAGALPVDPNAIVDQTQAAVAQVAALLPDPVAFRAAVMGCVSDLSALSPVGTPNPANPLGILTGLLGSLSGTPQMPSPAAVQAAITGCVSDVLAVLPDPTALASSLTTAFGGNLPGPVADLVHQLTGGLPAAPDATQLLDLVANLASATGSPADLVHQLTTKLDDLVPAPANGLLSFPLSIIDQVFSTLGL